MKVSNIKPINRSRKFDLSELFFSTTDRKGIISGCNEVFTKISGYSPQEILGQPHNIIRHPDMPRCVFKLLWDYILLGKPIGAYVKNMAKTGEYYWVFTLVIPIKDGFLSIRLKPSSELLPNVQTLYSELLKCEESFGTEWQTGMQRSGELLCNKLTQLGVGSYDDFMTLALRNEFKSRKKSIGEPSNISANDIALYGVFDEINSLLALREELYKQQGYFEHLGFKIKRTAINASVVAARMSESGRALGVISQEVSYAATNISSVSENFIQEVNCLSTALGNASFILTFSTLVAEMKGYFKETVKENNLTEDEQSLRYGRTCQYLSEILNTCYEGGIRQCSDHITALRKTLYDFDQINEVFSKILLTLQLGYITGKSISAGLYDGAQFTIILEDLMAISQKAKKGLESIMEAMKTVNELTRRWQMSSLFKT